MAIRRVLWAMAGLLALLLLASCGRLSTSATPPLTPRHTATSEAVRFPSLTPIPAHLTQRAYPPPLSSTSASPTQAPYPAPGRLPTLPPYPPPAATPTSAPLAALPTLPPNLPHPPLGYRWAVFGGGGSFWQGQRVIRHTPESIESLSPTDGQTQWRYTVVPENREQVQAVSSAGEDVFALVHRWQSEEQQQIRVVALEATDGRLRWQRPLPEVQSYRAVQFRVMANAHGVYVFDPFHLRLYALDGSSGRLRWQRQGCGAPWLATEDDLFATCGNRDLTRFDAQSGEILATLAMPFADPSTARVQMVYVGGVMALAQTIPSTSPETTPPTIDLSALRWPAGEWLWRTRVSGPPGGLLADDDSLVYRAGDTVRRVRLEDGAVVWETPLPEARGTNLMRVGGVLLVGSGAGYVHALDWATGFRLWEQDLWTSLTPPWLEAEVLGMQDEMLFATTHYGSRRAVIALAPEEKTTWPTPTATASATLVPTPTGLLPPMPVTPPPPAWTPSPPPPWTGDDDRQHLAQTYIRLVTDLLNATGGDPDAFLEQVQTWAPTPTPYLALTATPRRVMRTVTPGLFPTATPTATASPPPTPTPPGPPPTPTAPAILPTPTRVPLSTPAPSPTNPFPPSPTAALSPTSMPAPQRQPPASAWVHIADLDDDGAPEWLVSIPLVERRRYSGRDTQFFRCEAGMCPALVVLFEHKRALFTPAHLFEGGWLEHPTVLAMEDLNNDGKTELVLRAGECGTRYCDTYVLVGRWDGQRWRDLATDRIEQNANRVTVVDREGDGVKEIVMRGGVVPSTGAGLQRQHTWVYAWRDDGYRLVQDTPDPDPHPYFRMLDANTALASGDLDRALELAMAVVTQPASRLEYIGEWEQVRIVSYAAIEVMLVHALRHEPGAMEELLREMETKYDRLDNPYVEAGRRLWQTYRDTRDPLAACEAVERTVREQLDQARFFRYYGYNTERLPLQRVCPLDDSSQQVRERVDL